jgi:hypothetical protein
MSDHPSDKDTTSNPKSPKSQTREELRTDRQLRRELRKRLKLGEDVGEELLACEGRIEVLNRELLSIDEGGHEIFLAAKETISPKLNYPEKKKELKLKIKLINEEIAQLQNRIIENKDDYSQVSSLIKEVSMRKLELDDLGSEMNAILQFTHTQFLAIKENDKQQEDIDIQIESLEEERKALNLELIEANESLNMQDISLIQEKLAVVKDKIRKLTMPEDPLLGVLEDEDGDPFIEK